MKIFFELLRISHWTKNLICFAGVLFSGHINNFDFWASGLKTFLCFSLVSSSVYVFNDIIDIDSDTKHPKKKNRPIASRKISTGPALLIGLFVLITGLVGSIIFSFSVFIILLLYVINNIFYSQYIKKIPIADVFSIAFGFILRLFSGIYVVGDVPTAWITLCTMFMALFLGFSKRRAELVSIKNKINKNYIQRHVLKKYNLNLLDSLVNESSFGAILSYSLFTVNSGKNPNLIITLPLVYYAITYYKKLLFENKHGEEPDLVILKDRFLLIIIVIWLISYLIIDNLNYTIIS